MGKKKSSEIDILEPLVEVSTDNAIEQLSQLVSNHVEAAPAVEQEENTTIEIEEGDLVTVPNIYSAEWTPFVLSHLTPDELYDGAPRVTGLRRLTGLLIGPIIAAHTNIHQTPDMGNQNRATATHIVTILHPQYGPVSFTGAADAYHGNTPTHGNHPVAFAETRAEGRAYRRILMLSSAVISAEEKALGMDQSEGMLPPDPSKIQDVQIQGLSLIGARIDIDINKLLNKTFPTKHNIRELSSEDGKVLFAQLQGYQSSDVEDDIKGYDPNWCLT